MLKQTEIAHSRVYNKSKTILVIEEDVIFFIENLNYPSHLEYYVKIMQQLEMNFIKRKQQWAAAMCKRNMKCKTAAAVGSIKFSFGLNEEEFAFEI
ncbi:hypothetical protein T11_205 [Trichinella zimbabwensis]|uniref:Uncharacterized protein n=1 Tax=Trichinella zimbabwensis TaxID=268475 RepID=A0A0V1I8H8_9BILA|nr:hypothetical protein T11_205 [Trichinella zimbabwensis]